MISVLSLSLTDFRNYESLTLDTGGGSVILTGHNGAGKTNLLEAVSFLAPGRGMRRAVLSEVDRVGGGAWTVSAELRTHAGEMQIGTGRDASMGEEADKRRVRIDGKPARGAAALAEHVSLAWLTPQMDQLFIEGNSARRRFLDRLVYGFDPAHASRVNAYEQAMRERNRLLAQQRQGAGRADPFWLEALERKMAEGAVAIAAARLQAVSQLGDAIMQSTRSFPKAHLALSGDAEDALSQGEPALAVESSLAAALAAARGLDGASGRASVGAHRSRLSVTHAEKNMEAARCSTGEQKALLLAITLAEARAGAKWHARVPILLLDEVVAHLDPVRREELFQEIHDVGAQTWMTGTDTHLFEGMRDTAGVFRVENGRVTPR